MNNCLEEEFLNKGWPKELNWALG